MSGYSPIVPLINDAEDGFLLSKNIKQEITQNILMVLWTEPGERIFDLDFGVGLKRFLFQQNLPYIHQEIVDRIRQQIKKYIPSVNIIDIKVTTRTPDQIILETDTNTNNLNLKIIYQIGNFLEQQVLEI
jgi:phage baseplate assembly protein W